MTTNRFRGFSLVELMVALLISSILLGGVITMLSTSKRTYNLQDELSILQDNARFLIDEMTRQIRMAGYRGCSNSNPQGIAFPTPFPFPFASSQNNNRNASNGFPSSDRLIIAGFGELLPLPPGTNLVMGTNNIDLDPQAILPPIAANIIVSDCDLSQPYPVTLPVANNTLQLTKPLIQDFAGGPPEVFNGIQETIYEVGYEPLGLYRCQDNIINGDCDDPDQLLIPFVDGVQSIQVRYGVLNGNQIQFSATTDSNNVVAVRVTLLMRTPHKKGIPKTTDKTFLIDGPAQQYQPFDNLEYEEGFRHRLFSMTIEVRNSNQGSAI